MKKTASIFVVLLGTLALAGCSATERGAAYGAGAGAIIGGLTTGTVTGAAFGAGIGGIAGALIGRVGESSTRCVYEYSDGSRYIADCPVG